VPRTKVKPAPRRYVLVTVEVLPELHRLLINENHIHQRTLPEGFHAMLCEHFKRPELLEKLPPTRRPSVANGKSSRAR
jgi:hypothetical protein